MIRKEIFDDFSSTQINHLMLVLDVIAARKPRLKEIGGRNYVMPYTIPYSHFPLKEPSKINDVLNKLSEVHIIQDLELNKDEVSFNFSPSITKNREGLNKFKESVIKKYNVIQKNNGCVGADKIFKEASIPDEFLVSVKDREIWINDWFLSRPHAVGKNMELFLYLIDNPKKEIKKSGLPESMKKEIGGKSFIKILNDLGFKGEILKAFFPKRSVKNVLFFNPKVNKGELYNRGIKIDILTKELELSHLKNSSK